MAMNLRLDPEAAAALRAESARTGLSQQEILRRAVAEHLGLTTSRRVEPLPDWVQPPSEPYRSVTPMLRPPEGRSLADILDELREERL